jgi:hypothetical protein
VGEEIYPFKPFFELGRNSRSENAKLAPKAEERAAIDIDGSFY